MRMVTVHRGPERDRDVAYVKGAPGSVDASVRTAAHRRGRAPMTPDARGAILAEQHRARGGTALRVLALAYKELPGPTTPRGGRGGGLVFVGLVGMDRPAARRGQGRDRDCAASGHSAP
jgi:magnesium-transporting ATPase (P-type)